MSSDKNNQKNIAYSHNVSIDKDYIQWGQELKQRFCDAQIKSAVKVNSEQLFFN